ncbi:hypothetical protein LINPERPRIM_LOCUS40945 [Linum perenne]
MKSVDFWVSSIVLACLSGDSKAYLELEESARRPGSMACLTGIDTIMWGFVKEKEIVAKEVEDLNDSAAKLAAEISSNRGGGVMEAVDMQRKLDVLDKLVDGLTKDVDRLFSDILATRNELLRCGSVGGGGQVLGWKPAAGVGWSRRSGRVCEDL